MMGSFLTSIARQCELMRAKRTETHEKRTHLSAIIERVQSLAIQPHANKMQVNFSINKSQ